MHDLEASDRRPLRALPLCPALRCEPHDREIAEGRDRPFANPPLSQAAALVRFLAGCHSTFGYPTIQDHLHARSAHEEPGERPVKLGVVPGVAALRRMLY